MARNPCGEASRKACSHIHVNSHCKVRWVMPLRIALQVVLYSATLYHTHASQILLHAAANHAAGQSHAAFARPPHAAADWSLYHRTEPLLQRIRALASSCPHAHAQVLQVDDNSGTAHDMVVVTLAANAGRRRERLHASTHVAERPAHATRDAADAAAAAVAGEVDRANERTQANPPYRPSAENRLMRSILALSASAGDRSTVDALSGDAGSDADKQADHIAEDWPQLHADAAARMRVVVAFGEHGRELISSELALHLVELMCGRTPDTLHKTGESARHTKPGHDDNTYATLLRELHRTEFVLVPVVSPASRKLAENGRVCERLNARGVDVNRNFGGPMWGSIDENSRPDEEHPGNAPFSEYEARALHVLAHHIRPHAYISVHSGEHAIITPWDHSGNPPISSSSVTEPSGLSYISSTLKEKVCPICGVGTAKQLLGYKAYGTGVDFMHSTLRVPIALTFEIFGDGSAVDDDCVRMFNPVTEASYRETMETWSKAFATLSQALHSSGLADRSRQKSASVLGSGWAFVASRLGHMAWTLTAYNAHIRNDVLTTVDQSPSLSVGNPAKVSSSFGLHEAVKASSTSSLIVGFGMLSGFVVMAVVMRRSLHAARSATTLPITYCQTVATPIPTSRKMPSTSPRLSRRMIRMASRTTFADPHAEPAGRESDAATITKSA